VAEPDPTRDPTARDSRAREARPLWVVLALWLTFACLALVSANDLYALVALDDRLVGRRLWLPVVAFNLELAQQLGLVSGKARLDAWAEELRSSPVVYVPRREAVPTAPPPPVAAAPSPEQADAARRLAVALASVRVGQAPPPEPRIDPQANGRPAPGRVLLIGASSIQFYLGAELERRLGDFQGVSVFRLGKLSTGLTRPDLFDWPARLAALQAEFQPDLVIALFGGNDCQPIQVDGRLHDYGTPGWRAEYRRRLSAFLLQMQAGGARAVLLGQARVRKASFAGRLHQLNEVLQEEAERAGAVFVPLWDLTSDEHGRYRAEIRYRGQRGLLRLSDGIHFSLLGADFAAHRLVARLQRELNFTPRAPELALVRRFELDSGLRRERTSYLAFVPPRAYAADVRLPVVLLLHGREGDWTDWSEHAHEELQRLSVALDLVLVAPDGRRRGWYLDSEREPTNRIEGYLTAELLPDLERRLPVSGRRGLLGLSMGGAGALTLAARHPGLFASASSMSGAVDLTRLRQRGELRRLLGPYEERPEAWLERSPLHLVRSSPERFRDRPWLLSVGRQDRWHPSNEALHQELDRQGVSHEYLESRGGHDWATWLGALEAHLRWHQRQLAGAPSAAPATAEAAEGEEAPALIPVQPPAPP